MSRATAVVLARTWDCRARGPARSRRGWVARSSVGLGLRSSYCSIRRGMYDPAYERLAGLGLLGLPARGQYRFTTREARGRSLRQRCEHDRALARQSGGSDLSRPLAASTSSSPSRIVYRHTVLAIFLDPMMTYLGLAVLRRPSTAAAHYGRSPRRHRSCRWSCHTSAGESSRQSRSSSS